MNVGKYEGRGWRVWLVAAGLCGLAFVGLAEEKPFFGISVTTPSPALRHHLELKSGQGLVVASVHPDSPADKAGLHRFDVLLEVAGKSLGSERQLIELMENFKVGEKVTCWVVHKGKHDVVDVVIGSRPASSGRSHFNTTNPNTFVFEIPQIDLGANVNADGGHNARSMRTMMVHDGVFAIEARQVDGKLKLVVRDKEGNTVFDGPIADAEAAEELPERVQKQLRKNQMLPKKTKAIDKPKKDK